MAEYDIKDWAVPDSDEPESYDLVEAMRKFAEEVPDGIWLDIGAGKERQEGFIGLDLHPQDDQTAEADCFSGLLILKGMELFTDKYEEDRYGEYRLADNTVSYVYSSHFIEHLPPHSWNEFWEDLYRVCKPGAILVIIFPYGTSSGAFQDPTHRQVITIERFSYLNKAWRDQYIPTECHANVNFQHKHVPWFIWDDDFIGCNEKAKEYHLKHTFNAVHEAVVFLKCVKD